MEIRKWLTDTTASDMMVREVVILSPKETFAHAAATLLREQISGAPVVQDGVCIGVLSASDLLDAEQKADAEREKALASPFWSGNLALPAHIYDEKLTEMRDQVAPAAEQPIERFMTRDLVTVSETTPLQEIVQNIVDAHVHRVLVVDDDGALRGLVSTTNILAALLGVGG